MKRAACTIVSPNYLPFARTLAASYTAQHPGEPFFVLIVADLADPGPFQVDPAFTPVMLPSIGVPDLRVHAFQYDILELNTNVKPTFLKYLLGPLGFDQAVYLDPDIFLYAPLSPVFDALDAGATAVLTPHMTHPVFDGRSPSEQDLLYNGTYNLGFIALRRCPESARLLDWWEHRCLNLGFSEGRTGLFVDQKWINLAPGLFDAIVISRDPGLNMAYWNLHERTLTGPAAAPLVRDPAGLEAPLRFFHFSGLPPAGSPLVSRNTDRLRLADRPDLQPLFAAYQRALAANTGSPAEQLPYGFDTLSDRTPLNRLTRRLFAAHRERFTAPGSPDPFDAAGPAARFARANRLLPRPSRRKSATGPAKTTWNDFQPNDRRVLAVHRLLRLALRALGPHRYELLMRYLAFISVLRNQGPVIPAPPPR